MEVLGAISIGLTLLGMYQQGQAQEAAGRSQAEIIAFNKRMLEMSARYGTQIAEATGEFNRQRSENILKLIERKRIIADQAIKKMAEMSGKIVSESGQFTDKQIEQKQAISETFLTGEAGFKTEDITDKEVRGISDITEKGARAEAQVGRKAQFQVIGAKTKTQDAIGKAKASGASQGVFVGSGSPRDVISDIGVRGAMERYYALEDAHNSIKMIKDDVLAGVKSIKQSSLSERQAVEFGKVRGTAGIRQEAIFARVNNDFGTLIKLQELDNRKLFDIQDLEEASMNETNDIKGDALRDTYQIKINNLSNEISNRAGLYGMNLQMNNIQQTTQNQVTGTYLTGMSRIAQIGQDAGWFRGTGSTSTTGGGSLSSQTSGYGYPG